MLKPRKSSDDASTFTQPSITIYTARGFVPISMQALQDEQNVAQQVGRLLAEGKDDLEATTLATGSGSAPQGIVTALSAYDTSHVIAGTTGAFSLSDLYSLEDDVPAKYRSRASFLAAHGIYNLVRQFDTSGGAALWVRLADAVGPRLLDRPAYEAEAMDSVLATSTDDYIMVFGDFQNYVIADRIGTTVEFIPHLFAYDHQPAFQDERLVRQLPDGCRLGQR